MRGRVVGERARDVAHHVGGAGGGAVYSLGVASGL